MLSFTAAAVTVALLPAIVHSATKETLQIQIGKDKDILDTVTIVIEYDKPPEVAHPNGVKWADLEKDSLWEDNNGRHVRYNHAFLASMGSRKGYGSDYIDYTKRGSEEPEYSAGVSFIFPGDTLVQFSWEPVHMYFYRQIVPYEETGFVSGSEVYGQVSQYVKSGSENLTQGQWALLLTRKKERPIGETKPIVSLKETLHIQIGKDEAILDTVVLWIDYGKPPEIERPNGGNWADFEKDSAWTDDLGWYVRYNHAFLASMGSRKGQGGDYVSLSAFSEQFNGEPEYSANVFFSIPGDTTLQISWDPNHIVEKAEAYPFHKSGFKSGMEQFGEVSKRVGSGGENLAQGQWAKLLIRENGWSGFETTGSMALRPAKQAGRTDGWIVHLAPGTVLRAPPGATGLKVLDVQGRLHWESRNLREGTLVILPGELPKGVLRYYWQSERG
ncbi:MAG: hypothetical protein JWO30_3461 [Fibrobacteres bacterium]|nr:hypothetical protein [Fibrobacterota bacterium]